MIESASPNNLSKTKSEMLYDRCFASEDIVKLTNILKHSFLIMRTSLPSTVSFLPRRNQHTSLIS